MVSHKSISDRRHLTPQQKKEIKKKLDELCDLYNLPKYMGPLFLNEIKLNKEKDHAAYQRASLLGLV